MVVLMNFFRVLNLIIRWQNYAFSRMSPTMVISTVFFGVLPSRQQGQKKPSSAITLGAYFCQEWSHFMEGMLYFGYPKKSSIVNFDFLKLQKNTILQGKCCFEIFGTWRVKVFFNNMLQKKQHFSQHLLTKILENVFSTLNMTHLKYHAITSTRSKKI